MSLRILTFNLHSQYLHLLSYTGWQIDNLVIPPTNPPGWHSQPYGYPTHAPAVHPVPGYDYHAFFPKDWQDPPPIPTVPSVSNIRDVLVPESDYDLILYMERDSLAFYQGAAKKKVMVNFVADGFCPNSLVDEVVGHVRNIPGTTFIPMGAPDDYLLRKPRVESSLVSYAASRWRPHLIHISMLQAVQGVIPIHFHDAVENLWSYETLREALSQFWVYFSPVRIAGGPPLACVEAFMAGMPCILYDPYKHFAAFSNDECIRVHTEEEAVRAAKALWASAALRKEIGEAGQRRAREIFNINRFVEGWQRVAS